MRKRFIVDLAEREIRRREQRDALREAGGSWKDEEHPELADGADKWVREMRQEPIKVREGGQDRQAAPADGPLRKV